MADFAKGRIQAYVGPQELGAPDDLEAVIVDFIGGAKKTLDIAVQEIDSRAIAQAIINARWKGVSVRVFLEQDYIFDPKPADLKRKKDETDDEARERIQWREKRARDENREIFAALLRNGVDAKADYNPAIFHQKFIVRDYRLNASGRARASATSATLTGSTNFTVTGTHKNLNNILIFYNSNICKAYANEFAEIRSGNFGVYQNRRDHKPGVYNVNGVPVQVLFAPDHAPELEIIKQMLKCEKRLDFAIFTFAGSSGIDDAMLMLRAAKRKIRGAMDPSQGRQFWAATPWLHDQGNQRVSAEEEPRVWQAASQADGDRRRGCDLGEYELYGPGERL